MEEKEEVSLGILNTTQDVVGDFMLEINETYLLWAIGKEYITIEEIVARFEKSLRYHLKTPKPPA